MVLGCLLHLLRGQVGTLQGATLSVAVLDGLDGLAHMRVIGQGDGGALRRGDTHLSLQILNLLVDLVGA